jgi:asparagine synthase (glutamine-hydrolysing)
MCGLAGVVKWTHEEGAPWARGDGDVSTLKKMAGALAHRGPDGEGIWVDARDKYTVGLVHRRLAIVDLPGGAQPMRNERGEVWVVFNGEIYNHAVLRKELQAAGHVFASDHSDTEVLVHGWEEWGVELPKRLLGMFAFGVWDVRGGADTLFLARDRMGQKPLFYATLEDGMVFGSTIPSVLAWGEVPRRVPMEQIGLYLLLGYLPAPQTIWRDVSQVLPGGWLRIRKDVVDGGMYWKANESKIANPEQKLRGWVEGAVASQRMADVPIACFLSGGLDSSIVATMLQKAASGDGGGGRRAIQTVSVGFQESAFDETPYAEAVAKKIGSKHTRLEVNAGGDVMETLRMLMAKSLGQPFADSSILPTYHLSKAVRELAPVALSGDGADELFGGYDRYRAIQLLMKSPKFLTQLAPQSLPIGSMQKRERYRRFASAARAKGLFQKYARLVEIFSPELAEKILGRPIMEYAPLPEEYGEGEKVRPLRYAMRRDQQEYLPGDVLWKVDSASMAVGLEVRSPFLDHHLVELANSLKEIDLQQRGIGKIALRNSFTEELPPEIQGRPKKGFGVPIGEWLKGDLRAALTDILFAIDSLTSTHLNKPAIERLVNEHLAGQRDHTHRLFALLMLELWRREFSPTIETE